MTMRGEAIGSMLEIMDLLVQIMVAVMAIVQERMALWQHRARFEEQEDVERASASAEAQRRPPPAFVHLRPRPYIFPLSNKGKGLSKGKMKAKVVAATAGCSATNAFRFIEAVSDHSLSAVEDAGLVEDAD